VKEAGASVGEALSHSLYFSYSVQSFCVFLSDFVIFSVIL
jgi:hypothetical protein